MSAGVRERGDLFGPRFELFADVLGIGLATAVAAIPVVTAPAALSTACDLLRLRQSHGEPATAGRYVAALRSRLRHRSDWVAGCVLAATVLVLAADAALAGAGLPGARPFATVLGVTAALGAVIGLRACARYGLPAGAGAAGQRGGWSLSVRAAATRTVRDLPGSGLVLLALSTAGVCAWMLPPLLFLVPGPLALALVGIELRAAARDLTEDQ